MVILSPETVKFGTSVWDAVVGISLDRAAARQLVEWSDLGPHAVFADVPEERVTVRVVRRLLRTTMLSLRTGDSAELSATFSPTAGGTQRARLRVTCVVLGVEHDVSPGRGAVQTVTLVAVSSSGATDPIVVEDGTDGAP